MRIVRAMQHESLASWLTEFSSECKAAKMKTRTLTDSVMKTVASLAVCTVLLLPSSAYARDFSGKTITVVHSGETRPANNSDKQCLFKVSGESNWMYIGISSDASVTTCSIVMAAFLAGKKVSFDIYSGTGSTREVKYLCMADGNC